MSFAERELYAIEQLEKRRRMKEFERSYKERMRQNQLDRIERNQEEILNDQNWKNWK